MSTTLTEETFVSDSLVDRAWTLLFRWLLECGAPSRLEGSYQGEEVEFRRIYQGQCETQVMPARIFRPLLARLATTLALDPYGSSGPFAWQENRRTCYCKVFFCNDPMQDFWLKIYVYGASEDLEAAEVETQA